MENSVTTALRNRFSQWLNNSNISPDRAGLYEKVLEYIESHQLNPRSVLAWFREAGFELGNVRTPRFENHHYGNALSDNPTTNIEGTILDQAAFNAPQASGLGYAMDSNSLFVNPSRELDFHFESWQPRIKNDTPRSEINAEQAHEIQNLIQAIGSFRPHREDRIVIDDPVGPGKPHFAALNLFGQG